ncbi:hypothetical protein C5C27_17495, partial [Rathayibacter sp. AY2B7]
MIVLMLVPVLMVIGYSFFDNVITNPKPVFVGLANYAEVLGDPGFVKATGNTIVFVGASVAAHLVLGLGFAMLLNSPLVPTVAKSLFRVVYVLPWLFTVAIIAVLWRLLLNPNGVVNYALISLGLTDKGVEWLASPATALLSVTVINIWAGYSFYMITLLAGLQGIPHDLYEAAKVDGASAWQRFWNVTVPQLKPIIISMSVLDIIWTSQQFALIWMTTGGGPIDALVRQAEGDQRVVDYAVRVEQEPPQHRDDRDGEQPRQDVDDPEQRLRHGRDQRRVQQHREPEPEDQVRGDARADEDDRVAGGLHESRVSQDLRVVRESHEDGLRVRDHVVEEGVPDHHEDRDEHQDDHHDRRGGEVEVRGQVAAVAAGSAGAGRRRLGVRGGERAQEGDHG